MNKQKNMLYPEGWPARLRFAVEGWLFRHGFSNADARFLLAVQLISACALTVSGLLLCWYTLWVLWAGLGALLAVANFYFVVRKLQAFFPDGFNRSKIIGMLLNFYLRLFVTAVFLFVFIVWLKAPVSALLIGLSLSAGTAVIFGLSRLHLLKSKEA
ncbi:MAG: ATP synthase subunit I [Desulfovibrionaceae bacterium]|nr:ATP synthase subunit I [Desulfovibrionaceae bacterium]